jgi:amino acid permease
LDDNIIIQIGAIFCLILIFIEWFVCFFIVGLDFNRIPAFTGNQSQLLGTIIFNYAFVITVPSWVNEKSERVKINPCIWTATSVATVFYTAVGFFGGWAFTYGNGEDLLDALNNR